MALRIVFAGTPDFAASHLQGLLASEHDIVGVYSQPDRPAGRGKKPQPSPVKQLALQHEIPVFQPLNFKTPDSVEQLASLNADLMVVVAYGLILPEVVLNTPRYGCLNVHASLLPRWRGAAPIQRCIEAGDTLTGITIMQMDVGLDTGAMLNIISTAILPDDTGGSLHDRLAELGPPALLATLQQVEAGTLTPEAQDDALANYAHKLTKQEALIDWQQPATELALRIRAFNPFPMAYTLLNQDRVRVLAAEALETSDSAAPSAIQESLTPGTIVAVGSQGLDIACGSGLLRLTRVQLAGKKPMNVADLINGQPHLFQPHYVLASSL
ncbi:methionyl-tRNA formyltransferase [Oceanobacter sp. 3_MG-2023]|uniref:methionyl-tRNA formyltransferase n=1 Tax=Oceanobacter sp. 3_MG-2023 TaxID=3062622 RepID=UPI0027345197|nr:methionyl-tRNA formyltransferase [Oceanobacter sp. 3_MG-2023]MDP2504630.1 methionyl-tRNA formyltransferase [Oceanobacter sp. 3_MG-2023]